MLDIVDFYRQTRPAPSYKGQLAPEFQQALARRYVEISAADCSFTHTVELNSGKLISGACDLRGIEEAWLGHQPLWGKRALEVAPGSGWISSYAAIRARELVCMDVPIGGGPAMPGGDIWHRGPAGDETMERIRRGWWFVRNALRHEAQAVYADVDDPPDDLGMFEIALFGDALSGLASPYRALQRIARHVTGSIVLVVELEPSDPSPDVSGHPTTVVLVPGTGSGGSRLWHHAPATLGRMLTTCGFTEQSWQVFTPSGRSTHAALVARKAHQGPPVQVPQDTIPERQPTEAAPPVSVDTAGLDAAEGLPLPPPRLRHLVAGTEDLEVFVTLGRAGFRAIRATLARTGISHASIGRILDFGCGVGRVMRYWITCPGIEIHGTDLSPDAIAWDRENSPFAHVTTNGLEPSLAYSDGQFDLVYVLSVFTHLPEPSQLPWLNELARIVRPGGYIYFTTHGVSYRHVLSPEQQLQFDRGELVAAGSDPGSNLYGAFHPSSYVRRAMVQPCGLTLVEFQPEGAAGNPVQDSWLVRKD